MSYYEDRVVGFQKAAMDLIYDSDDLETVTNTPYVVAQRTMLYSRAAALCALARCETYHGQVDHPDPALNRHFDGYRWEAVNHQ
jgi:hypothetical protein